VLVLVAHFEDEHEQEHDSPLPRVATRPAAGYTVPARMGLKLHLGCGQKYLDGWVNCDVLPGLRVDRCFDLDRPPYPFADGEADEVLLDNVLEHLTDVVAVMTELHRLLRVGGRATIIVPYAKSDWALQDPTHKHFFTERSMDYFAAGHPYAYYSRARFRVLRAELYGDAFTLRHKVRNALPFKGVLRYFLYNIYDGVRFDLEKVPAVA